MADDRDTLTESMEAFYRDLEAKQMDALWRFVGKAPSPDEVTAPYQPCRWRWADLEPLMRRAGELVRPGLEAQRRVIQLVNPGLAPARAATHTLSFNLQMVLPGEVAPSHRHTLAAARFVLEGSNAITVVNGEPCSMRPGDLVLTPNWAWHGHTNPSQGPAYWIDVLDAPLVHALRAARYEDYPENQLQSATKLPDDSLRRYGAGHLRPAGDLSPASVSPLLSYPWQQTERALRALAEEEGDPFDDVALDYTNPTTGGHVLPTLTFRVQMLRPGVRTRAHRHSSSAVYHAFRGRGYSVVDGVRIDWDEGDFFALPPWSWHEHANASVTEEAILFSAGDVPVLEALGLYREEPYEQHGGQQEVTASYDDRYGPGA